MRFNPTLVLSSSALALTIGLAAPAFAQDTTSPTAEASPPVGPDVPCADLPAGTERDNCVAEAAAAQSGQAAGERDVITVTGSRIKRPTLSSPVPVTTVAVEELTNTGDVSLGDALNDLPSIRSTYSQGNSTRFIGTAGLNLLDLRGLGISRTLVLVNGKRHITASPGDYLVDVNTIPVDLLERVDVVTGGNSAVYGSDAVAGVVNFVLKRDYEGIALKGQGGISSRGDRGTYFVSGTYGRNFGDGRGNVAVSAEYAKAQPLYFKDRDYLTGAYSGRCQFQTVEPTGGEPFGTDGIFDTEFVCGVRNGSINESGTVARTGVGQYLRFSDSGTLYFDSATRDFEAGGSANIVGGNGTTLRQTGQLAAGLDRYALNLLAHYDVAEAFRPFVEAKYVHVDALQEGQPSFFNSVPSTLGGPAIRCNNGFLNAASLATLQSTGRCTNVATGTFGLSRFNVDFGGRGEKHKRDTFRIVGGVEGTFNEDWNYEIAVNYGHLKTRMRSLNNLVLFDQDGNLDGFNLAVDAVVAPASFTGSNFVLNSAGQRVICRVNAVTNTRPDCLPINVFGVNQNSQDVLDFVNTEARRKESASEFNAVASLTGDLSQLFELPGGPVAFALGAEYRSEKAHSEFDALTASGATFLNAIQPFNPPKFTVKEAFGEVSVPLLKDIPGAKELTISGAARVSDYNTDVGTVWAYNVEGIYAPVSDIRFRGAYATSVRAPTQSDLYSPQSQNFAQIADPCDSFNINNNPNRAANCAADGVPTTYNAALLAACASSPQPGTLGAPFRNCLANASSTGFVSGGNPTLTEERGKSLTLGAVFQPRWVPGFNFTVDYYKIKVKSLISALAAQTIINLCYDNPGGINNPFCATVQRDPATGLFVEPAVVSGGVNFAKQVVEGIDFDAAYRKTFANGHSINLRGIVTRTLRLDNYVDPTDPRIPNRQLSELGDPKWAGNFSANYDFGPIDVGYTLRYLGKQTIGTYEAQHEYIGVCPTTGANRGIAGLSGRRCFPGSLTTLDPQNLDQFPVKNYPSVFYHSARVNFEVPGSKKFNFYVGVDNMFDKKPPYGLLGTAGGDPYDTFGRFFYAGATVRM